MDTISGLPLHPLLVHLAVVAIPLAALLGIIGAAWPSARRVLGVVPPLVALVAVIITPLTTSAGEALEKRVPESAELHRHTDLGGEMIAWVAPLFVAVVLLWALHSDAIMRLLPITLSPNVFRVIDIVLRVAVIVTAIGSIVMVYLVGDSGARAVWLN
ncbi:MULTISPECIES: DUF2231 domain-containing protein [unclassified Gordonia (in: high G+C Gram-positive bacteria)]